MTQPPSGFQRRTFRLEFDDPSFDGLVVRCRSASLGFLIRYEELMRMNLSLPEHSEELWEMYEHVERIIISWNLLDDDNEPVGTDAAQLSKEEWPMIRQIVRAWHKAVTEVPPPLSRPSSDGDPLAGLNIEIPMETLPESASPPNSSPQSESSDSA
jgi:hypothetical protein